MDYQEYLKTERWMTLSEIAKACAGGKCQLCNSHDRIETHHRTYDNIETELEFFDLIVLCCDCHEKYHDKIVAECSKEVTHPELLASILKATQERDFVELHRLIAIEKMTCTKT